MALSKKAKIAVTGAGAVLALGLAAPAVAFAEDATPAPSASASASAADDREQRITERRTALVEGLAKELGVDKDKVAAALEKVESGLQADAKAERQAAMKAQLDQAVKDGKLTQEQADAVLKAHEAGVLPGGVGGPGGRGGHARHGGLF